MEMCNNANVIVLYLCKCPKLVAMLLCCKNSLVKLVTLRKCFEINCSLAWKK